MAVKFRGKSWTITFRPFGQQVMLALKGCESKRQAASIESELTYSLQSKSYDGLTGPARAACVKLFVNQGWEMPEELQPSKIQSPPKEFTFWDAVQLYVNDSRFKELSYKTRYEAKLAHLVKFFGKSKPVKEIWVSDLKLFRTHRTSEGVKNATINREMAALSAIYGVLIEHQIVDSNPCRSVKRLSEKDSERQVYISWEDIQRINSECRSWFQDILIVAYLTGMRRSEILKLQWKHINLRTRIISFHATETKESAPKRIPIHKDLMPIFERIGRVRSLQDDVVWKINNRPVGYHSLSDPWKTALKRLQWPDPKPRFHDLRHTWKTNARRSGIDSEVRETVLGHAGRKLNVSERYGFIDDYELVNAIDKFTYDNGLTQILAVSKSGKQRLRIGWC
jgi:integrase